MRANQGSAAGSGRQCGSDRPRQPSLCGGRPVPLPRRDSLAGLAGAFWPWKAVHTRFSRWAVSGVWAKLFRHLAAGADNEYAMIDSTVVRALKKDGEDQAMGRSQGGLSTKIHATVDALGNPTGFLLTPG
jgi:hypothetical protein